MKEFSNEMASAGSGAIMTMLLLKYFTEVDISLWLALSPFVICPVMVGAVRVLVLLVRR